MFELIFTKSALKDLTYFRKSEQVFIIDNTVKQLVNEPLIETKNRKPLRLNELAKWEIRIQKYRIFYDADSVEKSVKIKAVGWKKHNVLYIRKREFKL